MRLSREDKHQPLIASGGDSIEQKILHVPSVLNTLFWLCILTTVSYIWILENRAIRESGGIDPVYPLQILDATHEILGTTYEVLSRVANAIEGSSLFLFALFAVGMYQVLWHRY